MLGISRTQLRDILASLDREGFITRRHGVGTIINRHVLGTSARMDIEVEFLDMIRQSGHTPRRGLCPGADDKADSKVVAQLGIPTGTPILRISRLCTADGRPAIYCEDVVEKAKLQRPYTAEELRQPIFDFLQNVCGISSYLDLTDLRPVAADAALADVFQVPQGTPLLNMDEVDYDIEGRAGVRLQRVFCRWHLPPYGPAKKAVTCGPSARRDRAGLFEIQVIAA